VNLLGSRGRGREQPCSQMNLCSGQGLSKRDSSALSRENPLERPFFDARNFNIHFKLDASDGKGTLTLSSVTLAMV
jgi:hypothetical protein